MNSSWIISRHFGFLALAALAAGCNNAPAAVSDASAEITEGGALADSSADTGQFDSAATSDAGAGASCSSETPCSGTLFCDLPLPAGEGGCGSGHGSGRCTARPASCPAGGDQVCGCDGVTYPNDCLRQKAAVPIASMGACQGWEKGPISCGAMTCGPSQVCVRPGTHCGTPPACMPAPDGGPCPAGFDSCKTDTNRPGCRYGCEPPSPYCLDVPTSCRGLPTCPCLQPTDCYCEGISMGRTVVCSGAP
jgi:hypothetical protein